MNYDDQEFLKSPGNGPGVRKQKFYQGLFLVRRAAPEERHRNNLDILVRMFKTVANQSLKLVCWRGSLAASEKTANPAVEKKEGVGWAVLHRQGFGGAWQPCPDDFLLQNQAARKRTILQNVANRFIRIQGEGVNAVAADICPDPDEQYLAEKGQDQAANALVKTHKVQLR